MGASATKGEEAASPPRPNTDCLGPSPDLAEAASGMEVRGRPTKLKSIEAVAKPLASAATGRAGLLSAADILRLVCWDERVGVWVGWVGGLVPQRTQVQIMYAGACPD